MGATTKLTDDGPEITFTLTSPDGDMGFPGKVKAKSTYRLNNHDELEISMTAKAGAATPINMLHHSYFNLRGVDSDTSIHNHELQIHANDYTPAAAATGVPDGTIARVAGGPRPRRRDHQACAGRELLAPDGHQVLGRVSAQQRRRR